MSTLVLVGWQLRTLLASIVLSACGYLGFSLWGGWEQVRGALSLVGWLGTLMILAMSLLNYGLRFLRWQLYLHALGHRVPVWPNLRIYLSGFALTTTPGKAGEALRCLLLKPYGIPYPDSFAAFFSERLSDLLAIVLLALCGLSLHPQAQVLALPTLVAVVAGYVLISQRVLILYLLNLCAEKRQAGYRLLKNLAQVMLSSQKCQPPRLLVLASVLSLIAWGAEALAFHWVLVWMGFEVSVLFSFFVYALAMLAGALSFMPGGLGGAEAAMVGLLLWKGIPMPEAVAATVLIRMATLWFAVAIGIGCLLRPSPRSAIP